MPRDYVFLLTLQSDISSGHAVNIGGGGGGGLSQIPSQGSCSPALSVSFE